MQYFTKEWYHDSLVAQMCFQIRKDFRARVLSDKYFQSLYSSQKSWFVKHMKRAAKYSGTKFDIAAAEAEFDANYNENLDFIKSSIPSEILGKVADLRILALGCATQDIIDEITRFCGQVNRKCEKATEEYEAATEKLADKVGWYKINSLNMLANAPIKEISHEDDGKIVIVTSPEVTDIACRLTLFDPKTENGQFDMLRKATVLCFEFLDSGDGRFEFSMLCEAEGGGSFEFTADVSDLEIEEITSPVSSK